MANAYDGSENDEIRLVVMHQRLASQNERDSNSSSTPPSAASPTRGRRRSSLKLQKQRSEKIEERRGLLEARKDMLASMNAYSVVLVLLASITFVGFLQPPGGFAQGDVGKPDGTMEITGLYADNYIVPLTISFYLAVAGILITMSCVIFVLRLPQGDHHKPSEVEFCSQREKEMYKLNLDIEVLNTSLKWAGVQEVATNACLTWSLLCCSIAFLYAGYSVTDGTQKTLLRKVLNIIANINAALFSLYTLLLILSCFLIPPMCWWVEKIIASFMERLTESLVAPLRTCFGPCIGVMCGKVKQTWSLAGSLRKPFRRSEESSVGSLDTTELGQGRKPSNGDPH